MCRVQEYQTACYPLHLHVPFYNKKVTAGVTIESAVKWMETLAACGIHSLS